jgi:SAM-dependent methyltransferase
MGCGHVPLYETYCGLVRENVCIDWASTLHVNPYLDVTVDLNTRLPFCDGAFDTILLTDVLEHIAEPMQLMYEISRLLHPNGKLIVGVPFLYWLHEEPHDYYRYTQHTLRRFCQISGLTILELKPYGGLPEVFIDLTSKGIELLPRLLAMCLRRVHNPVSMLSGTVACRKISEWSKDAFPLGYILVAQKLGPVLG